MIYHVCVGNVRSYGLMSDNYVCYWYVKIVIRILL